MPAGMKIYVGALCPALENLSTEAIAKMSASNDERCQVFAKRET